MRPTENMVGLLFESSISKIHVPWNKTRRSINMRLNGLELSKTNVIVFYKEEICQEE